MAEREVVTSRLPQYDASITDADRAQAQAEFVAGLQAMTTQYDALIANFAWEAGQIAGSTDAPARMMGMVQFANAYKEFGLEVALGAIDRTSGVPVDIEWPDEFGRPYKKPQVFEEGLIVGLTGVESDPTDPTFNGVAMTTGRDGRETFFPVRIKPDLRTVLELETVHLVPSKT